MQIVQAPRKDKKFHLERLLEKGTVMIFLDSRKKGVIVPNPHLENPQLCLKFNYSFNIPDFKIIADKIEASLSFNNRRTFCTLPFAAIYAMTLEDGVEIVFFPEDIPREFTLLTQTGPAAGSKTSKIEKPQTPKLTLIASEDEILGGILKGQLREPPSFDPRKNNPIFGPKGPSFLQDKKKKKIDEDKKKTEPKKKTHLKLIK